LKEFVTSAQAPDEHVGKEVTCRVDDFEVVFSAPTQSQMAMLLAASSATGDTVESIADTINFFFSMVEDENQHSHLKQRLFDRDDPFEIKNIVDILTFLIEEWTARPTQPPSDSMPSQPSVGRRSTAKRQAVA
jgi:hypothetical protein